jgi:GrpB-like predicted nucleotidyltransferase (UPF0157 family)
MFSVLRLTHCYTNYMGTKQRREKIMVTDYKEKWVRDFENEKAQVLKICGKQIVSIEHIGSTSVPELASKPIIDIAVGIYRYKDADDLQEPLNKIGYFFYKQFQHQTLFIKRNSSGRRTHYLHIMRYNGAKWRTDQRFRNYLRTHTKERELYSELKKELAKLHPEDRKAYSVGKNHFIKSIITKANGEYR